MLVLRVIHGNTVRRDLQIQAGRPFAIGIVVIPELEGNIQIGQSHVVGQIHRRTHSQGLIIPFPRHIVVGDHFIIDALTIAAEHRQVFEHILPNVRRTGGSVLSSQHCGVVSLFPVGQQHDLNGLRPDAVVVAIIVPVNRHRNVSHIGLMGQIHIDDFIGFNRRGLRRISRRVPIRHIHFHMVHNVRTNRRTVHIVNRQIRPCPRPVVTLVQVHRLTDRRAVGIQRSQHTLGTIAVVIIVIHPIELSCDLACLRCVVHMDDVVFHSCRIAEGQQMGLHIFRNRHGVDNTLTVFIPGQVADFIQPRLVFTSENLNGLQIDGRTIADRLVQLCHHTVRPHIILILVIMPIHIEVIGTSLRNMGQLNVSTVRLIEIQCRLGLIGLRVLLHIGSLIPKHFLFLAVGITDVIPVQRLTLDLNDLNRINQFHTGQAFRKPRHTREGVCPVICRRVTGQVHTVCNTGHNFRRLAHHMRIELNDNIRRPDIVVIVIVIPVNRSRNRSRIGVLRHGHLRNCFCLVAVRGFYPTVLIRPFRNELVQIRRHSQMIDDFRTIMIHRLLTERRRPLAGRHRVQLFVRTNRNGTNFLILPCGQSSVPLIGSQEQRHILRTLTITVVLVLPNHGDRNIHHVRLVRQPHKRLGRGLKIFRIQVRRAGHIRSGVPDVIVGFPCNSPVFHMTVQRILFHFRGIDRIDNFLSGLPIPIPGQVFELVCPLVSRHVTAQNHRVLLAIHTDTVRIKLKHDRAGTDAIIVLVIVPLHGSSHVPNLGTLIDIHGHFQIIRGIHIAAVLLFPAVILRRLSNIAIQVRGHSQIIRHRLRIPIDRHILEQEIPHVGRRRISRVSCQRDSLRLGDVLNILVRVLVIHTSHQGHIHKAGPLAIPVAFILPINRTAHRIGHRHIFQHHERLRRSRPGIGHFAVSGQIPRLIISKVSAANGLNTNGVNHFIASSVITVHIQMLERMRPSQVCGPTGQNHSVILTRHRRIICVQLENHAVRTRMVVIAVIIPLDSCRHTAFIRVVIDIHTGTNRIDILVTDNTLRPCVAIGLVVDITVQVRNDLQTIRHRHTVMVNIHIPEDTLPDLVRRPAGHFLRTDCHGLILAVSFVPLISNQFHDHLVRPQTILILIVVPVHTVHHIRGSHTVTQGHTIRIRTIRRMVHIHDRIPGRQIGLVYCKAINHQLTLVRILLVVLEHIDPCVSVLRDLTHSLGHSHRTVLAVAGQRIVAGGNQRKVAVTVRSIELKHDVLRPDAVPVTVIIPLNREDDIITGQNQIVRHVERAGIRRIHHRLVSASKDAFTFVRCQSQRPVIRCIKEMVGTIRLIPADIVPIRRRCVGTMVCRRGHNDFAVTGLRILDFALVAVGINIAQQAERIIDDVRIGIAHCNGQVGERIRPSIGIGRTRHPCVSTNRIANRSNQADMQPLRTTAIVVGKIVPMNCNGITGCLDFIIRVQIDDPITFVFNSACTMVRFLKTRPCGRHISCITRLQELRTCVRCLIDIIRKSRVSPPLFIRTVQNLGRGIRPCLRGHSPTDRRPTGCTPNHIVQINGVTVRNSLRTKKLSPLTGIIIIDDNVLSFPTGIIMTAGLDTKLELCNRNTAIRVKIPTHKGVACTNRLHHNRNKLVLARLPVIPNIRFTVVDIFRAQLSSRMVAGPIIRIMRMVMTAVRTRIRIRVCYTSFPELTAIINTSGPFCVMSVGIRAVKECTAH